jgi:hypothetical protein
MSNMHCSNCLKDIDIQDEYVAEETARLSIRDYAERGGYRFYHWKCTKGQPNLRKLIKRTYDLIDKRPKISREEMVWVKL